MIRRFEQEMILLVLTRIWDFKHQSHRAAAYVTAHLSLAMAAFNLQVQ